jgi:SAM-dependent methyltransferase
MINSQATKWYQRSGFASLDDLESPHWKEVFRNLEDIQSDFLSHEKQFRSPEYRWPRDPLHFVARPWEYSYVLSNLKDWQNNHTTIVQPKVMDFGSGVTFFPFALAKNNMQVIAVDVDPIVQHDLEKASQVVFTSPGIVSFRLSHKDNTIPFETSSFDCIYSISVLEHIQDRVSAAKELVRVLKPQGFLILTFDVCFQGNADISAVAYEELTGYLRDNLELVWPEISIHPSRVISCYNGPYPFEGRRTVSRRLRKAGKDCLMWMIGKSILPLDCVFMGMVLRKT